MKCIFILCSYATCYLIFVKFKATYDSNHDTFRMEFIVVPVAGLAVLVNHTLTVIEVNIQHKWFDLEWENLFTNFLIENFKRNFDFEKWKHGRKQVIVLP